MEEWKNSKGEKVLREIGLRESQRVVDFGCGEGIYTLIISKIIGNSGKVFAIDTDKDSLDELKQKLEIREITNVELIHVSERISIPIENNKIDIFLLYDVYHLLDERQRKNIIKEAARVLCSNGLLTYHATHLDSYNVNLNDVKDQMRNQGLILKDRLKKRMFHWNWIEEGTILNFRKQ